MDDYYGVWVWDVLNFDTFFCGTVLFSLCYHYLALLVAICLALLVVICLALLVVICLALLVAICLIVLLFKRIIILFWPSRISWIHWIASTWLSIAVEIPSPTLRISHIDLWMVLRLLVDRIDGDDLVS
jgi:hypothetical protein